MAETALIEQTDPLEQDAQHIWKRLQWQYRLGLVLQSFFVFASVMLVTEILFHVVRVENPLYASIFCGLGAALVWLIRHNRQFSRQALASYLNHHYLWLEFSAHLLLETPSGILPKLQKQRAAQALVHKHSEVRVWPDFRKLAGIFVGVALVYTVWHVWNPLTNGTFAADVAKVSLLPSVPPAMADQLPAISSVQITVQPPAYTHLPERNASELSLEAPENAQVEWKCQLTRKAEVFQVIWNGKDTTQVRSQTTLEYQWKTTLTTSAFYQIRYGIQGNWFVSPVYTLHAITDQAPVITVQKPAPYTLVLYGQKPEIQTQLTLSDDYGLSQARLVATVSRGSGESVKFREVQLPFGEAITGKKSIQLNKRLDFLNLQMEPGDELYFYAETWDQARPAQKSRSDTYFVQWEDTTSQKTAVMAGISLDNMPAYFRSQRQIIIDTEKLIAERKGLTAAAFKDRSDELGVDQKVLRLRYGQFLGEEFETNIGAVPEDHEHEEGEDHDDDEDAHEKTLEQLHGHDHESSSPAVFGQLGNMLNGYEHRHDGSETATFFDETMKAQLKAALAQMWESELRLRTMRPQEALPFEYKALELIKNLQQKSRVYVERVGFKPPPLKPAEKRLTGELEEVKGSQRTWDVQAIEKAYPHLRQAVAVLEKLRQTSLGKLTLPEKQTLDKASGELAAVILTQPGIRVSVLNDLRQLLAGQTPSPGVVARIQQQFLHLLPPDAQQPGVIWQTAEPELTDFINKLNR